MSAIDNRVVADCKRCCHCNDAVRISRLLWC